MGVRHRRNTHDNLVSIDRGGGGSGESEKSSPTGGRNAANGDDPASGRAQGRPERPDVASTEVASRPQSAAPTHQGRRPPRGGQRGAPLTQLQRREEIQRRQNRWGGNWGMSPRGAPLRPKGPIVEVCGTLCAEAQQRIQRQIDIWRERSASPKGPPALNPGGGGAPPAPPKPPSSPQPPPSGSGEGVPLFRAVGERELADIQALGRYRTPPGGTEGKYFFPTAEQASNFARMMRDQGYTTTSVRVSPAEMARGQPIHPAGEGPAYFFSTPNLPSGPVTILNYSVMPP